MTTRARPILLVTTLLGAGIAVLAAGCGGGGGGGGSNAGEVDVLIQDSPVLYFHGRLFHQSCGVQPHGRPLAARSDACRDNVNHALAFLELDNAIRQREQGIVPPQADVASWMETGAALTHENIPGANRLTTISLDATVLRIAIPAIPAR